MEKKLEKMIEKQKKYRSFLKLHESSSSIVYKGHQLDPKQMIVLKIDKMTHGASLENEIAIYRHLHRDPLASTQGIPQIIAYEHYGLVMEKLGSSVHDLFEKSNHQFSLKFAIKLALKMLNVIKYVHSRGIVHGDIKPANFLFGEKNGKDDYKRLYLCDYGFSKFYLLKNGEHIPFREGVMFTGTPRFAGKWSLAGLEQSRREDLESFFYVIIYLIKGELPWDEKFTKKKGELDAYDMAVIKGWTKKKVLIKDLPKEFEQIFDFVDELFFCRPPDYELLKNLLKKML